MTQDRSAIVGIISQNSKYLGNGIIKLDSILNHLLDPNLITSIAEMINLEFCSTLKQQPDFIITAEASGIAPAFCVSKLLQIPLIYARKNVPVTMGNNHASTQILSRTKGTNTTLCLSKDYLKPKSKVLIVDDILGSGGAILGLVDLITQCEAEILGAAFVIEKSFENARARLSSFPFPLYSFSKVNVSGDSLSWL